jgi:hypothetical protein
MSKGLLGILLLVCLVVSQVSAANLFEVNVGSHDEAKSLTATGVEPVIRLNHGYLVLADNEQSGLLDRSKLDFRLIASDINVNELAADNRLDDANTAKYQLLFQEDNLRVYRVDLVQLARAGRTAELCPLAGREIKIEYIPPRQLRPMEQLGGVDLDSLIGLVSQDSLESYTYRLQAYYRRPSGSDSNYAAAAWTISKFQEFGYDSVYSDAFTTSIWGVPTLVENTVAVKLGTRFPERYIIVCGHRDGVDTSPAADDNGSGTASTLEIARVLKDIETYCSFLFITFDAEEDGLIGSEHFADEASANGDTIIWVLNADMIAYYENDTQAKLYHGSDQTYSELWQTLAQSLVGISAELTGTSAGSDHYPFQQAGYPVTFTHEYVFSTVYHSSHDSTSYMNFEYMTKIVKASVAAAYAVMADATAPLLEFQYPNGLPEIVIAGETTDIDVDIVSRDGGVAVPGTAMLHYSIDGGPFQTSALIQLYGSSYRAALPAVDCENTLEFSFSVEEVESGVQNDPADGSPYSVHIATNVMIPFADDFETDKGWVISGGNWQRGSPTGGGGSHGNPDPVGGHNSTNCFGYNLGGDYEANMPERHITSPVIDCSVMEGTKLTFWRWLGVETPTWDHAYVRISTNGTSWTDVWENSATITDSEWQKMEYDVSSVVDGQSTVYLRFTMGETDGSWQYCGWNIDDLELLSYVCETNIDSDSDGVLNAEDNCPFAYNPLQEDADGDGTGDVCDACTDTDDDGYGDPGFPANTCALDNCPLVYNPEQLDPDGDGIGTACDNCAETYNPEQDDSDGDNIGDACDYICGDADGDGLVNISDAVFVLSYIFGGGAESNPYLAADANCDLVVNISDSVYLIAYIFGGGETPCSECP